MDTTRRPPESFTEAATRCGLSPRLLVPSSVPGEWWTREGGWVRVFRYLDTVDPQAPQFRPGGRYRSWRAARQAWERRAA